MKVREQVTLAPYTTLGIGGDARFFVEARTEAEVKQASRWADDRGVPLFVLGGGSNLLIADGGFAGLVLFMGLRGTEREGCRFDTAAGENWDEFVDAAVAAGCAGVECLAGIPGSVGGTPVQNVGAYGQEVAETIASVRAFDRETGQFVELSREACAFRYRESVFNTTARGRYLVTRVRFQLRKGGAPTLRYADLRRRFGLAEESGASTPARDALSETPQGFPSLAEVARAVRAIRHEKGMLLVENDPNCRSAGSFFKNPIVEEDRLEGIAGSAGVELAAVPRWAAGQDRVKLPAAWLLERAGFGKGYGAQVGSGAARVSSRHTLALTNWSGSATCADLSALAEEIVTGVERRFGVRLEREPVAME